MSKKDNWTGERLETFIKDETMVEHLHRYALAVELCKNKNVLDIACGEGYGSNILAKNAKMVTGIDNDEATIKKAASKYKANNLLFKTADITVTGEADGQFDLVTCFETLEHVSDHTMVISELKRVLAPGGILLISTPDKENYSERRNHRNPWHVAELYEMQFKMLFMPFFSHVQFLQQCTMTGSFIFKYENRNLEAIYSGDYSRGEKKAEIETMYHIAICTDGEMPKITSSFFQYPAEIQTIRDEQTKLVQKSLTYRAGNIILFPFKFIRSLFRKK